ncbi:hypothetical protein, partial [Anaerobacillus sp. 1_MG-2023]|uniref:hypothetical protein n=1 Tax=Anaerobacillus sp. 1_MG-2023 TaxID=3062655 RepID=UPI0026E2D5F4
CRTRKLSSSAPMVVGGSPPARVGRRWAMKKSERPNGFSLFCMFFIHVRGIILLIIKVLHIAFKRFEQIIHLSYR